MQTPLKPDDLRKAKSERSRRLRSRDLAETAQGLGPRLHSAPRRCSERAFLVTPPEGTTWLVTLSNTQAAQRPSLASLNQRSKTDATTPGQQNTVSSLFLMKSPMSKARVSKTVFILQKWLDGDFSGSPVVKAPHFQ